MSRVLSIQSHVVYGYCGNKCATPIFFVNSIDADIINSVHFSTATNYPNVKGTVMTGGEFGDILFGLEANNLLNYSYIYNGYIGNPDVLVKIGELVEKKQNLIVPKVFVCDPVLGDNNRFYVSEELVRIYKNTIAKNADIILPNIFELEVLSSYPIRSKNDIVPALNAIHNIYNIPIVVLTSVKIYRNSKDGIDGKRVDESYFDSQLYKSTLETSNFSQQASSLSFLPKTPSHFASDVEVSDENAFDLILYASVIKTSDDKEKTQSLITLKFPYLEGVFIGVGDAFSSLFISHLIKEKEKNLKKEFTPEIVAVATEKSITALHHVLVKTMDLKSKELVLNRCVDELKGDEILFKSVIEVL